MYMVCYNIGIVKVKLDYRTLNKHSNITLSSPQSLARSNYLVSVRVQAGTHRLLIVELEIIKRDL